MDLESLDMPQLTTSIQYIKFSTKYDTEKPYYYSGSLTPNYEALRSNIEYEVFQNILVHDLRGQEQNLNLECNGFELKCLPFEFDTNAPKDSGDKLQTYMKALASWTKNRFGAEVVLCYDYRVNYKKISIKCGA